MPTIWDEQQRLAAAAAALWGMSLFALTVATTEATIIAIRSAPVRPKLRLVSNHYGIFVDPNFIKDGRP